MNSRIKFGPKASLYKGKVVNTKCGVNLGGVFTREVWTPAKVSPIFSERLIQRYSDVQSWVRRAAAWSKKGVLPFSLFSKLDPALLESEHILTSPVLRSLVTSHNIVTNEGLDEILDKFWKGSAYTAAHYVGLTDGTPTVAAGDTMLSHAGWAEVTNYDEATRQTYTTGAVASQSIDNSGAKATFTASSGGFTTGGAFLSTDNTRGGTTGTLICEVAFTGGDDILDAAETATVQYDFSAADDGV